MMLPLNLLSVNGLKQLAVKLLPWLVLIVVTVLLYLFAQHKWNEALETKYNAGVKDGKQAVVDEYENKAAQLRNKLNIDKGKIEYEAHQNIEVANRDAQSARDAADSLQRTLDKIRSIASRAGATVTTSTSTTKAVDLLADMLVKSNRRANQYAEFADRAFEAGRTCERQYDSLRDRIIEQTTSK